MSIENTATEETIILAFAGQKGGPGKSTVLISLASHLQYALGKKVLVIDADKPQWAVSSMRNNELTGLQKDEEIQQRFALQNQRVYQIQESDLASTGKQLEFLRFSGEYDVILVDTPGTLNMPGYVECLQQCDYIFTPIEAEEMSLTSTFEFIAYAYKTVMPGSRIKGVHPFWNKFIKNAKADLFKEMHIMMVSKGIKVMNQILEFSVHYQRAYMRSTIFPIGKAYLKSNLMTLILEIEEIILKPTLESKGK